MIYRRYIDDLPLTKIELDLGFCMKEVWRKLSCSDILDAEREVLYLLIHNKLPTKERIFRINKIQEPYCDFCMETLGAVISDRYHVFCACLRISETWMEVKAMIANLLPGDNVMNDDLDLITLQFPKGKYDEEIVWVIAAYLSWVWRECVNGGVTALDKRKFFGYLKFKFKRDQTGAKRPLCLIFSA